MYLLPVVTPPITPRKRVTSEGQTKKDKDIIDELQASVRSREKKRKEQEMMQAAEKERKLRELSVKLEKELETTGDSADGDEVLREVRSWRKRRESSLISKIMFFLQILFSFLTSLFIWQKLLIPRPKMLHIVKPSPARKLCSSSSLRSKAARHVVPMWRIQQRRDNSFCWRSCMQGAYRLCRPKGLHNTQVHCWNPTMKTRFHIVV